jgi:hypothetical protein
MPVLHRLALSIAAALAVAGCASAAVQKPEGAAGPWPRNLEQSPWFMSGVTPTAYWIERALDEVRIYGPADSCPFRLVSCLGGSGERSGKDPRPRFTVGQVDCRAIGPARDRCGFGLVERLADGRNAGSRCEAELEVVGTSHDPSYWAIRYDEYRRPVIRCK